MPSYVARCKKCNRVFKYLSTISARNEPVECDCGAMAERDVEAELNSETNTPLVIGDHERWSWSMAVPESQREEYKKKFPNHVLDEHGRVLIKNRKDKLQKMKDRGYFEYGEKEAIWK